MKHPLPKVSFRRGRARRSSLSSVAFLLLVALLAGCSRPTLPEIERLTSPEVARVRLEKEGARRERMSGHVKARMDGLQGLFASADLDVLIERPAKLHIAVRSFFEQPLLVLATDGVFLSGYDASSGSPVFLRDAVDGRTFERLVGLPIWPQDLVALFLGVPPAAGAEARQLAIDERARTYQVGLVEPQGYVSVVTARLEDDAMVRWQRYDRSGEPLFDVRYEDLKVREGVPFAHNVRLELPGSSESSPKAVRFEARDIEVNGAPFDPAAFEIPVPPGVTPRPLSPRAPAPSP